MSSAAYFTVAEWGWFAKPFTMREVFVSGANALVRMIAQPGPLATDLIQQVAGHLSETLLPRVQGSPVLLVDSLEFANHGD